MTYSRLGDCIRCGGKNRYIKGRRLCESCWMKCKATGELEEWPTLNARQRKVPGMCQCYSPVREELPMWGAVQCKRCGKKVA